jgi:hypothetical protein
MSNMTMPEGRGNGRILNTLTVCKIQAIPDTSEEEVLPASIKFGEEMKTSIRFQKSIKLWRTFTDLCLISIHQGLCRCHPKDDLGKKICPDVVSNGG